MKDFNDKVRSSGGSFKSLSRRVAYGAPGWDDVSLSHDLDIGHVWVVQHSRAPELSP